MAKEEIMHKKINIKVKLSVIVPRKWDQMTLEKKLRYLNREIQDNQTTKIIKIDS